LKTTRDDELKGVSDHLTLGTATGAPQHRQHGADERRLFMFSSL